jgi:hypothetical protein
MRPELPEVAGESRAAIAHKLQLMLAADPTPPAQEADQELMQVIAERDQYHEWADKLADAIAEKFGVDIGEHSNLNSPWANALEAIETPAQEAEPVAWRYKTVRGFWRYVGNKPRPYPYMPPPMLFPEPLYTHAPSNKLRQAAEEAIKLLEDSSGGYCREAANLRAALEGKS